MHVITRRRLREFSRIHPDAESALDNWYRIVKKVDFDSFVELRRYFPSADYVGRLIVFNIGGSKYRLIASIHFDSKKVFIRHILTHSDYNRNRWRE